MAKYYRCDTTNVRATKGMGGRVYSVVCDSNLTPGIFGDVKDIATGENDIREFATITNDEVGKAGVRLSVIATPEVNYSEESPLDGVIALFTIPAGSVTDAVPLESGDELAISEDLIDLDTGVTAIGNAKYLTLGTNGRLKAVASAPATGLICKIDKIKPATRQCYFGDSTVVALSYNMVYFTVNAMIPKASA